MSKEKIVRTGACAAIKELFVAGKTKEEIIALGFNKGTVLVQYGKFTKKDIVAPIAEEMTNTVEEEVVAEEEDKKFY